MLNAKGVILKKINCPFLVHFFLVNVASVLILFEHVLYSKRFSLILSQKFFYVTGQKKSWRVSEKESMKCVSVKERAIGQQ